MREQGRRLEKAMVKQYCLLEQVLLNQEASQSQVNLPTMGSHLSNRSLNSVDSLPIFYKIR